MALEFPDYFGANWDGFEECLRDLNWIMADGYILAVNGSENFWKEHPRIAGSLVQSWLLAAEEWALENVSFHLVFYW